MLPVFSNSQFRLFWASAAFGDFAMIMGMMARNWLTLIVTNSPFWVGAASGAAGAGMVGFSIFGGVLADRLDRRRLLLACGLARVATALALAALAFSGEVRLWHILALGLVEGAVGSVRVPTAMALTLDIAGRDRLMNANAALFAAGGAMGIVTPLAGGQIVSTLHIGWAFAIVACAQAIICALLLLLRPTTRLLAQHQSPWRDLKQGIRYVFTVPRVRSLILLVMVGEVFGWAHEPMLPVMARDVLGTDARGYGYLLTAASAGALLATIGVASVGDIKAKGLAMLLGFGSFGLFLMLFAASPWLPVSMALLGLAHGSAVLYETMLTTLLQTTVPDQMRGRVVSFQVWAWGLTGLSGFHTGAIASVLSAPVAIAIGGGVLVLQTLRLVRRAASLQEQPAPPVA